MDFTCGGGVISCLFFLSEIWGGGGLIDRKLTEEAAVNLFTDVVTFRPYVSVIS